jgi:hypothetical protein
MDTQMLATVPTLTEADETLRALAALPVLELEGAMMQAPQVECPVVHHFGPGIYIREVHMPAGTLAMGHHQKFEHVNILLQGKVLVMGENGPQVLEAPLMYVGKPGRKFGIVLEDLVWQNIYATELRDVNALEDYFIEKSEDFQEARDAMLELLRAAHEEDRKDYRDLIALLGCTERQVREETELESNQIPMPEGWMAFTLRPSAIEGTGTFIDSGAAAGDVIGPARIGDKRTPFGRWINHSKNPNAVMQREGDTIFLVALRDISGLRGGLPGDEVTVCYRQALQLSQTTIEKS